MKTLYIKAFQYLIPCTLLLMLFITFSSKVAAQDKPYNEEVTVVAPYEPTISDAFKINQNPVTKQTQAIVPDFKYDIRPKVYPTSFQVEPLKPLNIAGEALPDITKGYLKAGIGNYWTPYLEGFYNSVRNDKTAWGTHFKHFSANGDIKDYAKSSNSTNQLDLYGKKFFENQTFISGNLGFKRDVFHFYGFKPDDFALKLSGKDIKQRYTLLNGEVTYQTDYPDLSRYNYSTYLDIYNLSDNHNSSETHLGLGGDVFKNYDVFDFLDKEILGVKADLDYYHDKDSIISNNSTFISFTPYIEGKYDGFLLNAGLKPVIESGENDKFHLYPQASASVAIWEDQIILDAGLSGGLHRNTIKTISDENPFINAIVNRKNSNEKFKIYAGLKSNPTNELSLRATIFSSSILDMPFFMNDTSAFNKDVTSYSQFFHNKFNIAYDNATLVSIGGEAAYHNEDKFSGIVKASFNHYYMDKLDKPYYRPQWEASLTANYQFNAKLSFNTQVFVFGKRFAPDYAIDTANQITFKNKELDPVLDLNLGAIYKITEKISAFAQLNNITNSKYFLWNEYPSRGFNCLIGATYNF